MATKNTQNQTLSDIIKAETSKEAELQAKIDAQEAEVAVLKETLAADKAAKDAVVNEKLAPYRVVRDALISSIVGHISAREDDLAPVTEARAKAQLKLDTTYDAKETAVAAPHDEAIAADKATLEELEATVLKEEGAPAVVFNMDLAPAPKAKAAKSTSAKAAARKAPKVADLGVIDAVTIQAPHRYPQLDPTNPTTVMYAVRNVETINGTELVLFGKRIDHMVGGAHVLNQEAIEGGYTHESTRASEVASVPGWHSTKDVMYALAAQAGILGNFPEFGPESEASDILVDGTPLASTPTSAPAEVTIEEVV